MGEIRLTSNRANSPVRHAPSHVLIPSSNTEICEEDEAEGGKEGEAGGRGGAGTGGQNHRDTDGD